MKISFKELLRSASFLCLNSFSFFSSWLKTWVTFIPEMFSERKAFTSARLFRTSRYAFRENFRKRKEMTTRSGLKTRTRSVKRAFRMSIAPKTPRIVKMFLKRSMRTLVYISLSVLVSFVTLVTSFPTGILVNWFAEKDWMWAKTSSLILKMMSCPAS